MNRTAGRRAALWLLLVLSPPGVAADPSADYPALFKVYYDFEVASYCGLVTRAVGLGFRREARRLIERDNLDQETLNALRGDAWQAAHAEWQNRGLGGFKGWCRTEGLEAARRFAEGKEPPAP